MEAHATDTWKETLLAERIPLNCDLVFLMQNGGINQVLLNDKELNLSKKSRRILAALVQDYIVQNLGAYGWGIDHEDLNRGRSNEISPVKIHFNQGTPTGKRKSLQTSRYFERGDKNAHEDTDKDLGF